MILREKPRAGFNLYNELHLDGKGKQRGFLQSLKSNMRWACRVANRPEQSFREVRLLESAHPLLQYADMVTGAISAYANNQDSRWFEMLSTPISVMWRERFK
jgi:hypothetical protein